MRHDPIEVALLEKKSGTRFERCPRRADVGMTQPVETPFLLADAIDEAFADLPRNLTRKHRIDRPITTEKPAATDGWEGMASLLSRPSAPGSLAVKLSPTDATWAADRPLLGSLAAQVAALDRRCDHLSELLRGFEAAQFAE